MARSRSSHAVALPVADYEADDVLVVTERAQLRALSGEPRSRIVQQLRERALSTTQLAAELGLPKGTVGYHLKVLERARLVRVVRTRRVRAVTERSYGRVARLFLLKGDDDGSDAGVVEARLTAHDARRFALQLERLISEFRKYDNPKGDPFALHARLERR
jgi:DNA-binding transcriptional ArsR family regulator